MRFGQGFLVGSGRPLLFDSTSFTIRLYGNEKRMLFERITYAVGESTGRQTFVYLVNPTVSKQIELGLLEFRRCDFEAAYRIFSGDFEDSLRVVANVNCSAALHEMGLDHAAIEYADAALAMAPEEPFAFCNRAAARYYLGDITSALADLKLHMQHIAKKREPSWRIVSYTSELEKAAFGGGAAPLQ
jgi:tetratricopeptide (TPR) repeat protein